MWRFIATAGSSASSSSRAFHLQVLGLRLGRAAVGQPAMHALFGALGVLALAVARACVSHLRGAVRARAQLRAADRRQHVPESLLLGGAAVPGCWPRRRRRAVVGRRLVAQRFLGRERALHGASRRAAGCTCFASRSGSCTCFAGARQGAAATGCCTRSRCASGSARAAELPVLGRCSRCDGVPLVMSWCGFLFDTTIVGWLSWRRTRPYAYAVRARVPRAHAAAVSDRHVPGDHERLRRWCSSPRAGRARFSRRLCERPRSRALATSVVPCEDARARAAALSLWRGAYCALQLLLPLRFLAYGGNVLWHEQGMRFSWRVMVRAKGGRPRPSSCATSTPGAPGTSRPREYLTPLQESEMSSQPDLILQLRSPHSATTSSDAGSAPSRCASTRAPRSTAAAAPLIIDPRVDLARVSDGIALQPWILPAPRQPSAPYPNLALSPLMRFAVFAALTLRSPLVRLARRAAHWRHASRRHRQPARLRQLRPSTRRRPQTHRPAQPPPLTPRHRHPQRCRACAEARASA